MELADYYCPETTTSTIGYNMGRGVRALRAVTVETINPLKASIAVGAGWGGVVALLNAKKYKQGKIGKRDAVINTAGESVGMGLASGVGLLASNAARASLLIASTSALIPYTVGVIATLGAKVIWNCSTSKYFKCEAR